MWTDSSGSGSVAGPCEHGNENSGFVKCGEISLLVERL
jgi:hypothetical protein